jgi:hypothetical protein
MVSLLDKDTLALQHPDWGKSLWGCPPQPVQTSTLYETLLFRPNSSQKNGSATPNLCGSDTSAHAAASLEDLAESKAAGKLLKYT